MEEIWKPVPMKGYEDSYLISSFGRLKSFRKSSPKILKGCINSNGYTVYGLTSDSGEHKIFYAHRLVATAFIPNPENKPEVDHIVPISEGGGNEVGNLRWVTSFENTHNVITSRKSSEAKRGRALNKDHVEVLREVNTKDSVVGIHIKTGDIIEFMSSEEARRNGYYHVSACCRGKRGSSGGYKWYYHKEAIIMGLIEDGNQ